MIIMDLTKIKVKEIPDEVKQWCEVHATTTSFTYGAYFEYIRGEIVERTFVTRLYTKYGVRIREIIRHATGKSATVARDLIYSHFAGYIPVWEKKHVYRSLQGWKYHVFDEADFGKWYKPDRCIGVGYTEINPDMVFSIPEFKYCGYSGSGMISYINAYRKDRNVEFFGKMKLPLSRSLMKKAQSDSQFRRFLWENHKGIQTYGVEAALYAYKNGIDVGKAREILYFKHQMDRLISQRIPMVCGTKLDRQKVLDYVNFNDIPYASYDDYLKCCINLKLDLKDTKVAFPNDFHRMHDLRTSEYAAEEAKKDRELRAKLYKDFHTAALKSKQFEVAGDRYALIVPMDISDLKDEGTKLAHCVGKMGYDKKMADGVSLIMFCRKKDNISEPFVTVEYRLDKQMLNQCYGFRDSKPSDDVLAFVNEWANNLTKTLKANERNVI